MDEDETGNFVEVCFKIRSTLIFRWPVSLEIIRVAHFPSDVEWKERKTRYIIIYYCWLQCIVFAFAYCTWLKIRLYGSKAKRKRKWIYSSACWPDVTWSDQDSVELLGRREWIFYKLCRQSVFGRSTWWGKSNRVSWLSCPFYKH